MTRIRDNFSRPDRTDGKLGFADSGHEWIGSDSNWGIKNGKVYRVNNNGWQIAWVDVNIKDAYAETTFESYPPVVLSSIYTGIAARVVDGNNYYMAVVGLANRLTYNQSSGEVDLAGWLGQTGILERSTAWSSHGVASFRETANADNQLLTSYTTTDFTPAVAGRTYTASADVRAATTGRLRRIDLVFRDSANAQIGAAFNGPTLMDTNNSVERVSVTAIAPVGAVTCYVVMRTFAANTGEAHYFDAVTINEGLNAVFLPGGRPGSQAIYQRVNGGFTPLIVITPDSWDFGDRIGLKCTGKKLEALRNGLLVASVDNVNTFPNAGGWGLSGQPHSIQMDNSRLSSEEGDDSVRKNGEYGFNGLLMNSGGLLQVTESTGLFEVPDVKSVGDSEMQDHHGGILGRDLMTMRSIVLEIGVSSDNLETLHEILALVNANCQPRNDLIPLYYQKAGIGKRYILVRPRKLGGFRTSYEMAATKIARGALLLVAPDPRLLSAVESSKAITIAANGVSAQADVEMKGNFDGGAWPTIEIAGPATNPRITNDLLNRTIRIDHAIAAGETLIIDVKNRKVTKGGVDQFSSVRSDNQWWLLQPGGQTISWTRSNNVANTATMTLKWRDSYAS